jgi:hypothetical protein
LETTITTTFFLDLRRQSKNEGSHNMNAFKSLLNIGFAKALVRKGKTNSDFIDECSTSEEVKHFFSVF